MNALVSEIIRDFQKASIAVKIFFCVVIACVPGFLLLHAGIIKLPAARAVDCSHSPLREVIVDIKNDTFVPNHVQAHVCDTLIITNRDAELHEPAVGPHPTHTSYPGFDAKRPLMRGESFRFVLNRPGAYSFHDHLNDAITASITIIK